MLGKDLEHEFDDDAVRNAAGLLNKRANELEDELELVTDEERTKALEEQISELSTTSDTLEDTILAFKDAEELVGELRERVRGLENKLEDAAELEERALTGDRIRGVLGELIELAAATDFRATENALLRYDLPREAGNVRYMAIDRALAPKTEPLAPPEKPKKRARRGKRVPKVHPRQMALFTEVH